MSNFSSHASLDAESRFKKAVRMERIFSDVARVPISGRLLEVGSGSGLISHYFAVRHSSYLRVDSVDVADQRVVEGKAHFQTYDGSILPFGSESFDLVVSNHVIEHVGSRADQEVHLAELKRVLARNGTIYLAAPSRWQFLEPHFRLPGLSWIPASMRDAYVRLAGKGDRYDCNPMGHRELERMARRIGLRARNINGEMLRLILDDGVAAVLLRMIPSGWLAAIHRASPTMVYLLSRRTDDA